ncbi:MAG TPA: glycosyltransferase [Candidatus Baltobacteraceae bacterium]|nr:glycosyltransferase [Candidatus Baltobacteraceae bacterium]
MDGKLSVVMPAYNESKFIVSNIIETVETLTAFGYDFEIIVVDDGSPDATHLAAAVAKSKAPEVVRVVRYDQNRGKGHALLCGVSYARGDVVAFLDADMDLHPRQLPVLLGVMQAQSADAVVGSKLHPASVVNYPRIRRVVSYGYYLLVRLLFGLPVRDTQTGIKLFKRAVLERVAALSRSEKFAFDVELLCLVHMFGYRVVDAPITLTFQRRFGRIRMRDVVAIFGETMRIFVRLRLFAPVVKSVLGIGVRSRLSGTEVGEPPHAVRTVRHDESGATEGRALVSR